MQAPYTSFRGATGHLEMLAGLSIAPANTVHLLCEIDIHPPLLSDRMSDSLTSRLYWSASIPSIFFPPFLLH